eukprot:scaffold105649_cov27-Phaeocystis_antarctica.AAC.1
MKRTRRTGKRKVRRRTGRATEPMLGAAFGVPSCSGEFQNSNWGLLETEFAGSLDSPSVVGWKLKYFTVYD